MDKGNKYSLWRRRWLWWHSRSLLANALGQTPAARHAYIREMRLAYRDYGDFSESEIEFIFRRVSRGICRLSRHPRASELARRARRPIREQGHRLHREVSQLLEPGLAAID
ncbi:hypothetical protein CURE108131_17265 [Cupriavidus respiraculi]|uniref:Integrase n=1 Tax=Cupriavidus respiraculi TaxID=195930 RepID=A0ABN7YPW8_9BURK|nr:hypothetical protein [Cupriavidus respiraculi]MBY4945796.1 hypothetical protein [Cupriavidus respiraculi]CAG9174161.1 hypothetical protein LMG21510_02466 [Cupriavidus respiraculi]